MAEMDKEDIKEAKRETEIMKLLDHPYIVGFRESFKTNKKKLYIIMDYCDGEDLNA